MEKKESYALITGATSGFGFEFCRLFAAAGYNLVMVARSGEQLTKVSSALNGEFDVQIETIAIDLFKPEAPAEIYNTVKEKGIVVDFLVNDAGQGEYGRFWEYDFSRDVDLIQLNVTSLVGLTKFFLRDMIQRKRGRILQVSSLLGKVPTPLMAVYAGTKAFVLSFTTGLIEGLRAPALR